MFAKLRIYFVPLGLSQNSLKLQKATALINLDSGTDRVGTIVLQNNVILLSAAAAASLYVGMTEGLFLANAKCRNKDL